MNLTELRTALSDRADASRTDPADLITGARRRGRTIRRRRLATGIAAVGLAAAGTAAVLPALSSGPGDGSFAGQPSSAMPSRPIAPNADDVSSGEIRFRQNPPGERLSGAVIGQPGQTRAQLRVTLKPGSLLRPACVGAQPGQVIAVTVNKTDQGRTNTMYFSCGPTQDLRGTSILDTPFTGTPGLFGRPVTLHVALTNVDGKAVADTGDAQIGLGAYDRTDLREVGNSLLPTVREHLGVTYRLTEVRTTPRRMGAAVEVPTPGGVPFLVSFGSDVRDPLRADAGLARLTGLDRAVEGPDKGDGSQRVVTVPQTARSAGHVTATSLNGPPASGSPFGIVIVALYLPAG